MIFTMLQLVWITVMPYEGAFYKCSKEGTVISYTTDWNDNLEYYEVEVTGCIGKDAIRRIFVEPQYLKERK